MKQNLGIDDYLICYQIAVEKFKLTNFRKSLERHLKLLKQCDFEIFYQISFHMLELRHTNTNRIDDKQK